LPTQAKWRRNAARLLWDLIYQRATALAVSKLDATPTQTLMYALSWRVPEGSLCVAGPSTYPSS
jgi:hypothetical protein